MSRYSLAIGTVEFDGVVHLISQETRLTSTRWWFLTCGRTVDPADPTVGKRDKHRVVTCIRCHGMSALLWFDALEKGYV